jgi:hypothetical protein
LENSVIMPNQNTLTLFSWESIMSKKSIKCRVFAAILSLILLPPAFADKGVFNALVAPNEMFINIPTSVTISAEIGAEDLYLGSVMAYQTTKDGSPITRMGQMYDDGSNGDQRPADTIFTMQFDVNEPTVKHLYFRVTAAYRGDRGRYLSPVMEVSIYQAIADNLFDAMAIDLTSMDENFTLYLQTMNLDEARQRIYQDALANPNIVFAELSGDDLSIIYQGGISGWLPLNDPTVVVDGAGNSIPSGLPEGYKSPGNDKLLIYAPGYGDASPQNQIADHAKSRFDNAEYMTFDPDPPSIIKDSSASLGMVASWGNYGTVIIHTHGGLLTDKNGNKKVVLLTGTKATVFNRIAYMFDLISGRIGISKSGKYYIFPAYITKHSSAMKNTFFYLGACRSLKDDSMWNALKSKGAKVGFGWSETVFRNFNTAKFTQLSDAMLPITSITDPATAKAAFDGIASKCDSHPIPACLQKRTASADWDKFVFTDGGIVNGDFETGDWTGWVHGGDYNFRLIAGSRKHGGAQSAALGRWDTAFHGQDPTIEPLGYEWFYQDFTVPQNVTTLKFYWWMETYDTAVWDWFDAYIQDTNGNILTTILSQAGKPGTDYGPYWTTEGWREVSVDISAYQGQEIRIYFDQRLDGYGDQQRVYVDDVTLE